MHLRTQGPTFACHLPQDLNSVPGLCRLLHFLLHRLPPRDLWVPLLRFLGDGQVLVDNMVNLPPAPPHRNCGHWFRLTPFKKVFVLDGSTLVNVQNPANVLCVKCGQLWQLSFWANLYHSWVMTTQLWLSFGLVWVLYSERVPHVPNSSSSLYQGRSSLVSTVSSQNLLPRFLAPLCGSIRSCRTNLLLVLGSCSLLLSYQGLMCFLDHALLSFSLTCAGKVTMAEHISSSSHARQPGRGATCCSSSNGQFAPYPARSESRWVGGCLYADR